MTPLLMKLLLKAPLLLSSSRQRPLEKRLVALVRRRQPLPMLRLLQPTLEQPTAAAKQTYNVSDPAKG